MAFFRSKATANTRILHADQITQKHTCMSADQLFLVAVAQQNASPVLLTLFYNRSLKNKSHISKTLPTLSTSLKNSTSRRSGSSYILTFVHFTVTFPRMRESKLFVNITKGGLQQEGEISKAASQRMCHCKQASDALNWTELNLGIINLHLLEGFLFY